jgi:hypothetical protein
MSNFDKFQENCYLHNLLDSIHSQHIWEHTCPTIMDIHALISYISHLRISKESQEFLQP